MKRAWIVGLLLLAASGAALAAQTCPAIETSMVGKGFGGGPWRVMSGGPGECSFMAADTSVNFGFSHIVGESPDLARKAALEMRDAVAATSVVEPMPSLGEEGFAYRPKNDAGEADPKSMFFYGHRGRVGVSGYLNLASAITPAQRDFAAGLIAGTLGVATKPKALAKETDCPYLDDALVKKLLPSGNASVIVPDRNNCVMSADGRVITVAVTKSARSRDAAEGMMRSGGCTLDPLPRLGTTAGVVHHCFEGNARAQVIVATGGRMLEITYVPGQEPTDEQRATLVELAEFALKH
ncbi:hypothetical protein [Dokdonella sp.]|uniref:hypothetical protein n=1 Tax=Dokdonella sp. TaxID=2291710 RepID=UPI002F3E4E3B